MSNHPRRRPGGTSPADRPVGGAPISIVETPPSPSHATHETAVASSADPLTAPDAPAPCTSSQLRRFIKSRPYVPMHELRRRFELNGEADDLALIEAGGARYFLGLPQRESLLIADLVSQGEVGLELCRDPSVPVVVGVYALRPIIRG